MFSFVTYGIGTTLILFFYLDGHHIVKNTTLVKWDEFRKINKLVSTNYKGYFTVIWISLCMIIQALWINFIQYTNRTISPIEGNKYIVTYVIKGKTYKMVVKPRRGPSKVIMVSDKKQEDVSFLVFPYMGPEEDFHGKIYSPKFFKKDELVFELSDGTKKIFLTNDDIILTDN